MLVPAEVGTGVKGEVTARWIDQRHKAFRSRNSAGQSVRQAVGQIGHRWIAIQFQLGSGDHVLHSLWH